VDLAGTCSNMEDIFSQFGDIFGEDILVASFGGGGEVNSGELEEDQLQRGTRQAELNLKKLQKVL